MLIQNEASLNTQEKRISFDDYQVHVKRTVQHRSSKLDAIGSASDVNSMSNVRQNEVLSVTQNSLSYQTGSKDVRPIVLQAKCGSAELKASGERQIVNFNVSFVDQRNSDMQKSSKQQQQQHNHFGNELLLAGLQNDKILSQTLASSTNAYQLGSINTHQVISAQGISRSSVGNVLMQQPNNMTKYLNINPSKHIPPVQPLGNMQTQRHSLEKLKEFETKLLQQSSSNNQKQPYQTNEDKNKGSATDCNFTVPSETFFYGQNKAIAVLTSSIFQPSRDLEIFVSTSSCVNASSMHGKVTANKELHTNNNDLV